MEKTFFKIIVPNYNNMPYIKKCLDSILGQTFQDFKIIVVDDQSTDCSDEFCKIYSSKFNDKIIYHRLEKKGYAGAARNWGIDYPDLESEYTWFVDSDDWLYDDNVLKNIHDNIMANNFPDLVRCSYAKFAGNSNMKTYIASTNAYFFSHNGCSPWQNCIRSSIKSHFYENRPKANDVIWMLDILDNINNIRITCVKTPCVIYNIKSTTSIWYGNNKNSTLANWSDIKLIDDLNKKKFKTDVCNKAKNKYIYDRQIVYGSLVKKYIDIDDISQLTD